MARVNGARGALDLAGDAEVQVVRERIAHWRQTRTKRTAMSEELWAAAVSLTEGRDVHRVARALKVNYETLTRRVVESELERLRAEAQFVEVSPAQMLDSSEPALAEIELSSGDGSRLTIRLPAAEAADVTGRLAEAFWRRGQ